MISTEMKANIINCVFQTDFCMFKVNKSEFNVIVAITSHPVEASKNYSGKYSIVRFGKKMQL